MKPREANLLPAVYGGAIAGGALSVWLLGWPLRGNAQLIAIAVQFAAVIAIYWALAWWQARRSNRP